MVAMMERCKTRIRKFQNLSPVLLALVNSNPKVVKKFSGIKKRERERARVSCKLDWLFC